MMDGLVKEKSGEHIIVADSQRQFSLQANLGKTTLFVYVYLICIVLLCFLLCEQENSY